MTLSDVNIGESVRINRVGGDGALRQHFLDMGIIPGAFVSLKKFAPMGDPMQVELHGYALTLRKADAALIEVEAATEESVQSEPAPMSIEHPGIGEGGRFHDPTHEHPLPEGTMLTFALVGNQNCGKTTLFNQLTGANQHVGNFPGVTVDRKSGSIRGYKNTEITDLPGIYSLSPYTQEEIVSREFILTPPPGPRPATPPPGPRPEAGGKNTNISSKSSNSTDTSPSNPSTVSTSPASGRGLGGGVTCLINIIDTTNIERNLYLTMQLMELGIPMVLALNFFDELTGNGGTIHVNEMEKALGIPVIPVSALKNEGVHELIEHAVHVAKYQEAPARQDFCPDGPVHRSLHAIMHLIQDHAQSAGIPLRFAAAKLVEGDSLVEQSLKLSQNERETIEHILVQMEEERGMDRAAAMAEMRYDFIEKLCRKTVVHPRESKEAHRSQRIDKILTGRWTALPSFVLIMGMVFWLTFDVIGGTMQGWLEDGIDWFTQLSAQTMDSWQVDDAVKSLIIDGVYAGVGSVASFVPIIVTLFFFLSMLEDTGYMARIAFVMDTLLRKLGLSGRSIVPLLIGFGCSVPAVMSSRTLPSERDRRLTVMLTPFMSCTAKLPIYAFFCAAFFPDSAALVMCGLYVLGIVIGIIVALVLKKWVFKGEAVPFVMELPNYRLPGLRNTLMLLWEKARDFLQRAFTVIFCATIMIWFLQSFSFHLVLVDDASQSILGQIANVVAPVFEPLGFGDWRLATALVGGFLAKESVVSTITVLFGEGTSVAAAFSAGAAGTYIAPVLSFMVFSLLYTPCVAAISSIRRELGNKDALAVVFFQCLIAYAVAFVVYSVC